MSFDPEQWLRDHLGGPVDRIEPLSGGLVNQVFKVVCPDRVLVLKHAAPHLATNPEIELPISRMDVEVEALKLLRELELPHGVQWPEVLVYDRVRSTFLMSFVQGRGLAEILAEEDSVRVLKGHGRALGRWLGALHAKTSTSSRRNEFARRLDNTAIQEVRAEVQYRGLAATLDDPRFDEPAEWVASRLSRCAGECMILGDLWPASLLLNGDSWGVIDLEFAHWGFPEQDLAHLLAHLRMWTLCSVNSTPIEAFAAELTDAYFEVSSWQEENFKAANIHLGFEILARTVGPFKSGYLFENASLADINTAKSVAKRAIIGPYEGIGCYKVS